MQEIVLILGSIAGIATAAAVRKMPREKNQLLSLGASSHIKSQITSLKIEKDILTKTISRLYQTDSEFPKIQKDKLLTKYQHQLGTILAKLEKLEQASKHPDLGPVGDGLVTLMDQKLSKLDDRLYELSSKMSNAKIITSEIKEAETKKQEVSKSIKNTFNFEKQKDGEIEPITIPITKSRQSFELTTLTNISKTEPKFPSFEKEETKFVREIPEHEIIQSDLIKAKEEIVKEIIQPDISKSEINLETKPNINNEIVKNPEHKILVEPEEKPIIVNDDFDDDGDDLDKIKRDITKVLSKLDQSEVE